MKKVLYGLALAVPAAVAAAAAYRIFRQEGPEVAPVDDPRFAYPYGGDA